MESIQQEKTEPIPLRAAAPHGFGTIMIRFIGLLFLAIGAMALVWLR